MKKIAIVSALALSLIPAVAGATEETSSGHKAVSAISVDGVALNSAPVVAVQIAGKARKKKMLLVEGVVFGVSLGNFAASAFVNGVRLEPGPEATKCNGSCTLTVSYWLDLDLAEIANPGLIYYNKTTNVDPLQIELHPSATTVTSATVSLTAHLLAK